MYYKKDSVPQTLVDHPEQPDTVKSIKPLCRVLMVTDDRWSSFDDSDRVPINFELVFFLCLAPVTCCSSLLFWTTYGQDFFWDGYSVSASQNMVKTAALRSPPHLQAKVHDANRCMESQSGSQSSPSHVQQDQLPCSFFRPVQFRPGRYVNCSNFKVSVVLREVRLFCALLHPFCVSSATAVSSRFLCLLWHPTTGPACREAFTSCVPPPLLLEAVRDARGPAGPLSVVHSLRCCQGRLRFIILPSLVGLSVTTRSPLRFSSRSCQWRSSLSPNSQSFLFLTVWIPFPVSSGAQGR